MCTRIWSGEGMIPRSERPCSLKQVAHGTKWTECVWWCLQYVQARSIGKHNFR